MKRILSVICFSLMLFCHWGVQYIVTIQDDSNTAICSDIDSETEIEISSEFVPMVLPTKMNFTPPIFTLSNIAKPTQELLLPISYEVEVRPPRI